MRTGDPTTLSELHGRAAVTTLLITDIVGSTELVERLGDRAWLDLLRRHNELVRREVERHRGFEVKSVGDGFVVAFSEPELGLRCAMAIQRALAAHNDRRPSDALHVRIGLHVGTALEDEADLHGREVHLAVRVSSLAATDEILVSEAFRAATDGSPLVAFDGGREVALKGLRGHHRVYRAEWRRPAPAGERDPRPLGPALFERGRELHELAAQLEEARGGRGGIALVAGPAGIGKTALVERFLARAREDAVPVLTASAEPLDRESSFGVARRLLRPTVARLGAAARAEVLGDETGPAAALLGFADGAASAPEGGDDAQFPLLAGLTDVLSRLAGDGPLIVAVDDAQWADDGSIAWLHHLATRIGRHPVLAVVAVRAEALDDLPAFAALAARGWTHPVTPAPLTRDAVAALALDRLAAPPSDAFTNACLSATGGNPFYAAELLHALAADGVRPDDAGAELVASVRPPAVQALVSDRLAATPDPARRLARACAALGHEADLELAARLAGLRVADAVWAADVLVTAGILRARRPLRFTHPIVAATVLASATPGETPRLHRAAARLLAGAGKGPLVVAGHLLRCSPAGDPAVVDGLLAAARQAVADGSAAAAVRYLDRAVLEPPASAALVDVLLLLADACLRLGEDERAHEAARRASQAASDPLRTARAALLVARASYGQLWENASDERWRALGPAALELVAEALAGLPDGERELRFRLESARLNLGYMAPMTLSFAFSREHDAELTRLAALATGTTIGEREILGESAAEAAVRARKPTTEIVATARRALAGATLEVEFARGAWFDSAVESLIMCDTLDEARAVLEAAATRAAGRATPTSLRMIELLRLATELFADQLEASDAHLARIAALGADAPEDRYVNSVSLGAAVALALARDDPAAAEAAAERIGHERLRHHGRGLVHAASGLHDHAVVDLSVAQAILQARGVWRTSLPLRPVRPDLALSLLALGRDDEAIATARAELEVAERVQIPSCLAEARRALGLCTGGAEGEALLRGALAAADACPAPSLRARARRSLAERLAGDGGPGSARAEAERLLIEAHALADGSGLLREARLAAEALTRLG